jgi:hypothetical protein
MATKITQVGPVGIGAGRMSRSRAGWTVRACAVLALLLVLAAVGVGPAAADELEEPTVVPSSDSATGSLPGWIIVRWGHSGQGLNEFSVERENPYFRWDNVNAAQRNLPDGGLQPDTTYRYRVCAYFNTDDGEPACSPWQAGKTSPPEPQQQQRRPPRPRIVEHHAGHTWVGIKWEAGYDYDSYFVNITGPFGTAKGPRELRTIHHDDDGTWSYQRVDGLLPGRAYGFSVQGCTETIFGFGADRCWDWAPEYPAYTSTYPLHSGPDTCAPPFVWREAFAGDRACVELHRRQQVAADNAQAQSRRAYICTPPNCTFTAPDTCKVPFVWREARPSDHVCVPVPERTQVAAENALANQRRAAPR